jgi:glycosyltransferase involved in cell wall biosynthesis
MAKVVYWNHSPTPYFVARFNAIARRGKLDFEAWFNDRREPIRSWDVDEREWLFPARYIPTRSLLGWSARVPVPELLASRPDLLVQEYDRAHLSAGFLAARALASRTAFRVLPNYDAWSERTWWRETAKQAVFRAVDAAKVPGPDGAALARRYGLPADRIATVTQSIDVERLGAARGVGATARAQARASLGLEGCVFIYVGRLWSGKGVDDLFAADERLADAGVSLLLLGDGPDEQRYRERAASLPRVVFGGFVQAKDIAAYYSLADTLVFPTLGDPHGLVVEEAMAAGLPVICSDAAGDIEARLPRSAGRVVPVGDAEALERSMRELASDPTLRERMGQEAAETVAYRTHERYAEDFEAFVEATLARPARQGPVPGAARLAGRTLAYASRAREPVGPLRLAAP